MREDMSEEDLLAAKNKRVSCLQLLLLLIPEPNYNLLRDLLGLLHSVSLKEDSNKMSAVNLGTLFAPLILCPRKLSAESLQSNHQLLTRAVAYMVEDARTLFDLPERLQVDLDMYLKNRENSRSQQATDGGNLSSTPRTPFAASAAAASAAARGLGADGKPQSPVVNTVFSFVDRERTSRVTAESSTEAALAALYAHVQSMPESAQKKKLVARLNDANGQGTPGVVRGGRGKAKKRVDGEGGGGGGLRGLLTPKRSSRRQEDKIGRHGGSYSLNNEFKTPVLGVPGSSRAPTQLLHSFKRHRSESTGGDDVGKHQHSKEDGKRANNQKLLSPQSSPALLVSPSALESIARKQEETVEGSTEARSEEEETAAELDGSYVAPASASAAKATTNTPKVPPPVPARVSSLSKPPMPPNHWKHAPESVTSPASAGHQEQLATGNVDKSKEGVGASPISVCARAMTEDMQRVMMTPRSRRPVMHAMMPPPQAEEDIGAAEWEKLQEKPLPPPPPPPAFVPPESPCTLSKYNEDEPEEEESKQIAEEKWERNSSDKAKNRTYTSRTLKTEFQTYLEENNMDLETSTCTSNNDESRASEKSNDAAAALEESVTSSVVGKEAERLLSGETQLSDSMRDFMDGKEEEEEEGGVKASTPSAATKVDPPVTPSVLTPVDVDIALAGIDAEEDRENESYLSARSYLSSYSTASTVPSCQDIPLPSFAPKEELATSPITIYYPNNCAGGGSDGSRQREVGRSSSAGDGEASSTGGGVGGKSRKRRSLTEISELNPMSHRGKSRPSPAVAAAAQKNSIYFETDL